jgi:hypothetical protein
VTHLVEFLAAALAGVVVAGTTAGVLAVWWFRRTRRRLRAGLAARRPARLLTGGRLGEAAVSGLLRQPFLASGWWRWQLGRAGMWRAVHDAERAVADARAAGAPVGELPALCRQLRAVAAQADAALRVAATGGERDRGAGQVADVLDAARALHRTAARSMREVTGPPAAALRAQTRQEADALAAGLARWHGGEPAPGPTARR